MSPYNTSPYAQSPYASSPGNVSTGSFYSPEPQYANAGMTASGRNPETGLVEIMEISNHPFFIGCQYHPELKSRPTKAHPLFAGLIGAAIERQRELRFPLDESELRRKADEATEELRRQLEEAETR